MEDTETETTNDSDGDRGDGGTDGGTTAVSAATAAREQFLEFVDRPFEQVVGIEKGDDGWKVQIEVVETHRIPDSTDILALYDVQVDQSGELTGYRRNRRYTRGHGDD